jgi:cell wall-associated NlpC family hydrolase
MILRHYALSFVGRPYKWGGSNPMEGMDCSGFVQELLASVGAQPPTDMTAQALHNHFMKQGARIGIHACGSLAFYGKDINSIIHVGMLLDEYLIVEAGGGGSKTTTLDAAIAQNAFVRVRPIKYRKDFLTVIKPRYMGIGDY